MFKYIRPALVMIAGLTLITGIAYSPVMTRLAQTTFPDQANGSRIEKDGVVVGSALIGQSFITPQNFQPRGSAAGEGHDEAASVGSNLGVTRVALTRRGTAETARPGEEAEGQPVPMDLITASGRGLDPHISPEAALFQLNRVARQRGLDPAELRALVMEHIEPRSFGVLGEPVVNVLKLNLALEAQAQR